MTNQRSPCPVCKLADQEVESTSGDKTNHRCARCGEFTISRRAVHQLAREENPGRLSAWLRERNLAGSEVPLLTTTLVDDLLQTLPKYTPTEKQNRLLRAIETLTDYPGKDVVLIPEHEVPLAWAESPEEFTFYVESLLARGLLVMSDPRTRTIHDPLFNLHITPNGWEYLERLGSSRIKSSQAFVAMSFDPSLRSTYLNAIAPAIASAGYTPYRVDSAPHLDRIDVKIVAEIKQSHFLVADVTQQKPGVYYEAGFAQGLGIPVIWCVKKNDLPNVHFDTRQYNHLLWESEDELRESLASFIVATIGKRAT
jgi:hypothetical protein